MKITNEYEYVLDNKKFATAVLKTVRVMGMTEREFAAMVGRSERYFTNLRTASFQPSMSVFMQTCNILDLNPFSFFSMEKVPGTTRLDPR